MTEDVAFGTLPGGDLVERGLSDLAERRETPEAVLIEVARSRLSALGLPVPETAGNAERDAEIRLYERLGARYPERDPYPLYCAWLDQLDSFLRALALVRARE